MDKLITALAPVFAAGFAVQQLRGNENRRRRETLLRRTGDAYRSYLSANSRSAGGYEPKVTN